MLGVCGGDDVARGVVGEGVVAFLVFGFVARLGLLRSGNTDTAGCAAFRGFVTVLIVFFDHGFGGGSWRGECGCELGEGLQRGGRDVGVVLGAPDFGDEVGEVRVVFELEVVGHFVVGVVHEEHGWGLAEFGGVVEVFHAAVDAEEIFLWNGRTLMAVRW